jgi:hypothetical protein
VAPLLPAGTVLHIQTWHDNTADNKHNPDARNWVGYGARAVDEEGYAWVTLYYLDDKELQERIAARAKQRGSASP